MPHEDDPDEHRIDLMGIMNDDLRRVEKAYGDHGERLWIVGGSVRDAIAGLTCNDVDLATTASPQKQAAICDASRLRWIGTGMDHGTITVLVGSSQYEITTLRRDVDADGRHAVVEWTPDVLEDLGRRDLTINAMASDLDGRLIDPHGGRADLIDGRIRFVGDARRRIEEDHLRILRWFRFHGRFGSTSTTIGEDLEAIRECAHLLRRISGERIWSEMQRILLGPNPIGTLGLMHGTGTLEALGLPPGDGLPLLAARRRTDNPGALMAAWQGATAVDALQRWNSSRLHRDSASFMIDRMGRSYGTKEAKGDLVAGSDRDPILALLEMRGRTQEADILASWNAPSFPLKGADLVSIGIPRGPRIGRTLARLKDEWAHSGHSLTRKEMLDSIGRES